MGGGTNSKVQVVFAANTKIMYTRKKANFKDLLQIVGPTNGFLRVVVSKCSLFLFLIVSYYSTIGQENAQNITSHYTVVPMFYFS